MMKTDKKTAAPHHDYSGRWFVMGVTLVLILGMGGPAPAQSTVPIDPRGPISVPGLQGVLVDGGVEAQGGGFNPPPDHAPLDKSAWVWLNGGAPQTGQPDSRVTCFRKEIVLPEAPKLASAWVSADWHYRLYINGRLAGQGPADAGEDYPGGKSEGKTGLWFCDYRDLTPLFHKGRNAIAVEVFTQRIADWYGSSGSRGLFFDLTLKGANGAATEIKTDDTWRGLPAQYFGSASGRFEYLPAKEPAGWHSVGFDDSTWNRCGPAGDHWPGLRRSELPPPVEMVYPPLRIARVDPGIAVPDHPFQSGHGITINQDGHFSIQYDRVLSGYASLKINGGDGALLTVEMNERNGSGGRRSAAIALTDGIQYFQTPFYSSFTVLNITVSGVKAPFTIEDVSAIFSCQPVLYRGSFACSDEGLTRLWRAARWATQLCMQDHYLDSPDHQEPICDPGDYMIEALLNDYAFDEPSLTRQDLRKFGALLAHNHYINFHTSYALLWLQMLMDDYDYTGDATLVRELSPQVYGLLDRFTAWRGKNGLISEAPDYMFMDWVNIAGFGVHHPPAVIGQGYMTAFYYRALADGERVAQLMGDSQQSAAYQSLRKDVVAAFNRELWSADTGLYRDGKPFVTSVKPGPWLPADTDIQMFSPHVNTLAVLYDLAPGERQAAIMQKVIVGQPLNCQPYFMHFVLSALAHTGLFDADGTAQLRRWHIDPLTGTFQEMWNSGDWSHGWGGTPLYQLSSKVLGVTPLEPGFRLISIRPTLCDLPWAGGTVPTPHGSVKVAWSMTKGGMRLDVTAPSGTRAQVMLPTDRFRNPHVTVNGKARRAFEPITVASGSSQFLITGDFLQLAAPAPAPVAPTGVPPSLAKVSADSAAAFENDVVKNDLIHPGPTGRLLRMEDHASSAGGAVDAAPLLNGTTLNGTGEDVTVDDGKTFRGYGNGDWVTFYLDAAKNPHGFDITKIITFAGHADSRASQNYAVSIALVGAPDRFIPLIRSASAQCNGGSSEVVVANRSGGPLDNGKGVCASGVAALRFDFRNGSAAGGTGLGFNVYREINLIGSPSR